MRWHQKTVRRHKAVTAYFSSKQLLPFGFAQLSLYHRETCTYQQTWDVDPMLVYCWPTVYDAGPTVNQRWANVSCFFGWLLRVAATYRTPTRLETRWQIKTSPQPPPPTTAKQLLIYAVFNIRKMAQCWVNVGKTSRILAQCWFKFGQMFPIWLWTS